MNFDKLLVVYKRLMNYNTLQTPAIFMYLVLYNYMYSVLCNLLMKQVAFVPLEV